VGGEGKEGGESEGEGYGMAPLKTLSPGSASDLHSSAQNAST